MPGVVFASAVFRFAEAGLVNWAALAAFEVRIVIDNWPSEGVVMLVLLSLSGPEDFIGVAVSDIML